MKEPLLDVALLLRGRARPESSAGRGKSRISKAELQVSSDWIVGDIVGIWREVPQRRGHDSGRKSQQAFPVCV